MPICAFLALLCSIFLILKGPTLMDRLFGVSAALPALAILISMLLSAIK
jgi:multisubunit Na+/H+ antiporter MnhF subunit